MLKRFRFRAIPFVATLLLVALGVTLGVLLVMTAVFDNVMIGIGLVAYNESLISGAFIGIAPLEDFAYAIAAVVGLPSLWVLLDRESNWVEKATESRK